MEVVWLWSLVWEALLCKFLVHPLYVSFINEWKNRLAVHVFLMQIFLHGPRKINSSLEGRCPPHPHTKIFLMQIFLHEPYICETPHCHFLLKKNGGTVIPSVRFFSFLPFPIQDLTARDLLPKYKMAWILGACFTVVAFPRSPWSLMACLWILGTEGCWAVWNVKPCRDDWLYLRRKKGLLTQLF